MQIRKYTVRTTGTGFGALETCRDTLENIFDRLLKDFEGVRFLVVTELTILRSFSFTKYIAPSRHTATQCLLYRQTSVGFATDCVKFAAIRPQNTSKIDATERWNASKKFWN